ncbi:MAG TPA: hypothetical protein VKA68_01325 [bacterium]|nr:hypothetical protein [bacterium]
MNRPDPQQGKPTRYQITIKGVLDDQWRELLEDMTFTHNGHNTTMTGPVRDQAELHGMLARLRDLNLTLLSLQCLELPQTSNENMNDKQN